MRKGEEPDRQWCPQPKLIDGTAALLESILVSEEEHKDWLEAQLHLIATVGESAYLSEQIRAD